LLTIASELRNFQVEWRSQAEGAISAADTHVEVGVVVPRVARDAFAGSAVEG
jgi:hypothetical protein